MARQSFVLQVFVASPSDVKEERELMESVIKQLNQIWSSTLGITYELLKWETNVRPAFSTEPQAVINTQIGSEYDVFIGIFWGRIGTSTQKANSGTVEEFQNALSRNKSTGGVPEIMLYFKDAPIPPSKVDTQQLQSLLDFKKSLSSMGGVYSVFEDQTGFESSLRAHLSAVAQSFVSKQRLTQSTDLIDKTTVISNDSTETEEDDYGYLDYFEIYEVRQAEMVSAMTRINEATVLLGEQLNQRSSEINSANKIDAKQTRRLVKRGSEDMNTYAETMKSQVPILSTARKIAFDALSNSIALQADFHNNDADLLALKEMLETLSENAGIAAKTTSEMRTAANSLPRITKEINQAKRVVVNELDTFISEIESIRSTLKNIIESVDRMRTNESDDQNTTV
jgi:hypothetical protein